MAQAGKGRKSHFLGVGQEVGNFGAHIDTFSVRKVKRSLATPLLGLACSPIGRLTSNYAKMW